MQQSQSHLAPIGVNAALDSSTQARPKIFEEFALTDRVGIVSGGNRGLGLEMALALCEAGARAIYCLDLPENPSDEWVTTKAFVEKLGNGSRLEYVSVDVTDQKKVWKVGEEIGDKEQRMDVCVAAACILKSHTDCLEYPAEQFQDVRVGFVSRGKTLPDGFDVGHECERKWSSLHCSSSREANDEGLVPGKHYPDRFHVGNDNKQGVWNAEEE